MRWSWRVGSVSGIRVQVHWTFLILIGWVVLQDVSRGADVPGVIRGVVLVAAVFACVVLHELGHALTARRYGIATRDITLLPIGGVARLERMPEKPMEELWVAAMGPAVNVAIAGALAVVLMLMGNLTSATTALSPGAGFLSQLLWINVILVVFNLLPAFPMDGGRILRGLLGTRLGFARATAIAASVGQLMAMVFGFLGLIGGNPFLIFIAIFVYLGAQAESRHAQAREALRDLRVGDVMVTELRVFLDGTLLSDAAAMLAVGSQRDFPVVDAGGRLTGLVLSRDLGTALRTYGPDGTVRQVARRDVVVAAPQDPLHDALLRLRLAGQPAAPVVEHGTVVGLLAVEQFGEFLMVRRREPRPGRSGLADLLATD